jgi:HEAT repeat protein
MPMDGISETSTPISEKRLAANRAFRAPFRVITSVPVGGINRPVKSSSLSRIVSFLLLATIALAQTSTSNPRLTAKEVLNEGLRSKNPETRKQAVLAVGLFRDSPAARQLLLPMVKDSDAEVRIAVISSLADLNDPAVIPPLRRLLDDPVPEVAFAAAKALLNLHQPAGEEAIIAVVEGEKKAGSNPIRAKFRGMERMMHTPGSAFLLGLRQGAGFAPVPGLGEGMGALQDLLLDKETSPQATAALLLSKDKSAAARRALREALFNEHWPVRAAAAQAIAMSNDPKRAALLVPLLDDGNEKVRFRAAGAWMRLTQFASPARSIKPRPVHRK